MREHSAPVLLHEKHSSARPETQANAPAREVIHERNANHTAEITIERDEQGRTVKKTTRELQQAYSDLFGNGEWKLSDLSPERQGVTTERYEYDTESGRLMTAVEEKFNGLAPETPYFTRTITYTYADNGELEEQRIEFKGFTDKEPLTYTSRVTTWDDEGRPAEIAIEDNRSREMPQNIKRVRTYDERGRVASEVDISIDDQGKETEKESCMMKYDEQGRLLERNRRIGGEISNSKYDYQDLSDGGRVETRRSYDHKGRENMGERVNLGADGAKLRYESWFTPDTTFSDTTWTTKE